MQEPVYIETKIVEALKGSQRIQAIIGGNVFPLKIPQGTPLPCVVYQRIYTGPDHTLQGYGSESVLVMVNSFAMIFGEVKDLALAVRSAMAGEPLKAVLRNETDLYNDDVGVYCISAEYTCQQTGGYSYA